MEGCGGRPGRWIAGLMDILANHFAAAALLVGGLSVIGLTSWVEHSRERRHMPELIPMTPFMLLGMLAVLAAVIIFLALIPGQYTYRYVAGGMLAFGAVVIGITALVERHR